MTDDQYKRVMALDYGAKRIGIAISDPMMIFATPFKTILNNNNTWKELEIIIKEKNIIKIILGLPVKESGKESEIAVNILRFKTDLINKYKTEVELWDERYTSAIASEMILLSVSKKKKRREKGLVDRNAAAVILQEYLNSKG